MALCAALMLGCAPRTGWTVTDVRTCAADGPPRLCLEADPDRNVTATIGGATLVPGECALGPDDDRGGPTTLVVTNGAGTRVESRLTLRRGSTVHARLGSDLESLVVDVDRRPCD